MEAETTTVPTTAPSPTPNQEQTTTEPNPATETPSQPPKTKRDFFKVKFAVFFGYSGKGFNGLQFQRNQTNVKTIERALEDAFVESLQISPLNQGDPYKTGWGRASRTDKGVHAVMNGINVKLDIRDALLREDITEEEKAKGKGYLKF